MNKEEIEEKIKNWINENREQLPLNIDCWKLHIQEINNLNDKNIITLGKFKSQSIISENFYKPISRIITY